VKRECLVHLILTLLICASLKVFSGCANKVIIQNGRATISTEISKKKESEPKKVPTEISLVRPEEIAKQGRPDSYEFTLEEMREISDELVGTAKRLFSDDTDRHGWSYEQMPIQGEKQDKGKSSLKNELWIVEKTSPAIEDESKGESPKLMALLPDRNEGVILPLESTSVDARISGYIATVDILQKYHNPYKDKIDAVYVFPLPQSAAITDFVMIIGDRMIRGLIREKEEAQEVYQAAKAQGYHASLLTQERPNIFKQKVANIEPGKKIDIISVFFNPLNYRNGEYEFVFPTVVGPRFNPPGQMDDIGTVGRGTNNQSGDPTDAHYLRPDKIFGHNISIHVDIDAGVSIEKVYSHTHVINVEKKSPSHAIVSLSHNDMVPNKDFVLRYKTSGEKIKTAMMTHESEDGIHFSLLLQPPEDLKNLPRIPREMVFVLDCSCSMYGRPLEKAKEAVRRALRNLDKNDTFQIIRFSSNASSLGSKPITATPENIEKGLKYLESLKSGGGTMMIEGIKAALDFLHDENRLRIVSFMTDGYIGNEREILGAIHEGLGESRIFSFGVGSSVNRYLLERMAIMGRGAVAYVGLDDSAGEAVDRFYDVATRPALANITIDWGDLNVTDVYPEKTPDLFVGRPVMITGRLNNSHPGWIRIIGQTGKERTYFDVTVDPNNSDGRHPGIRSIWARWKLAELSNQETHSPCEDIKQEIITTSMNYNLISRYTAFLAVDSLERTEGDHGYVVDVPVFVPDGVQYDTTVEEQLGMVSER
jgi:Ca-activated chloride channel family protein